VAIDLDVVRRLALVSRGIVPKEDRWGRVTKLPAYFSTHPGFVATRDPRVLLRGQTVVRFKVLSSAEARATCKTGARRPHRILVWDELCNKWQFAGKYAQHCKFAPHAETVRKEN